MSKISKCACGRPERERMEHSLEACVAWTALPYVQSAIRTSGHTGSEASRDRAEEMDARGVTSKLQRTTLSWLEDRKSMGGTQAELQHILDTGHGTASQVLSNLHAAGLVERLATRRLRSQVYVLPEWVDGRPTSGYRRLQSRQMLRQRIDDLEKALASMVEVVKVEESGAHPSLATARLYGEKVLRERLEDPS